MEADRDLGGARFVVVAGGEEGHVYRLPDPAPSAGWVLGSAAAADLRLAADPYVSREHARVLGRRGAHVLVPGERTFHNWRLVPPGAECPLAPGDLVGVGMTLLMYRPG